MKKQAVWLITIMFLILSCPVLILQSTVWTATAVNSFNEVTIKNWVFNSTNTTSLIFCYSPDSTSSVWFTEMGFSGTYTFTDNRIDAILTAIDIKVLPSSVTQTTTFTLNMDGIFNVALRTGVGHYNIQESTVYTDESGDVVGTGSGQIDIDEWDATMN